MLHINTENSIYVVDTDKKTFVVLKSSTPKDERIHNQTPIPYNEINTPVIDGILIINYINPVNGNPRLLTSSPIRKIEHVD